MAAAVIGTLHNVNFVSLTLTISFVPVIAQLLQHYVTRNLFEEAVLVAKVESVGGYDCISRSMYINVGDAEASQPHTTVSFV